MRNNLNFAKQLRQQQTPAEELLWWKLRNRKLLNCKFRRQVPIGPYIADFYCAEASLIIELDGSSHAFKEYADSIRETFLKKQGYTILRFKNHTLYERMDSVMDDITGTLTCILSLEKGEER